MADLLSSRAQNIGAHLRAAADAGPRPDGSDADLKLVAYIEGAFGKFGLTVAKHPIDVPVIVNQTTRVEILAPERIEVEAIAHMRAGLTPTGGIEAPLVYCGRAFPKDIAGRNLGGSIALAYEARPYDADTPGEVGWHLEKIHRLRDAGAAAVIFCTQRIDNEITTWGLYGLDRSVGTIASVGIGFRDFERLRTLCEHGPVKARLTNSGAVENRAVDVLSVTLPGSDLAAEEVVFIGGHHETVPSCTGVNDNGSGIGIMLEALRLLKDRPRRRTLRFVITCGEESGCWGSESYLEAMPASSKIRAVLNVDQVAGQDVRLIGHGTPWLNAIIAGVAAEMGLSLGSTHEEPKVAAILGDAEPWWQAGHPSAMLSGWWSDPAYHTRADTLARVNANYLKIWCDVLATATDRLANGDLPHGHK